jgi:hypothetical protein
MRRCGAGRGTDIWIGNTKSDSFKKTPEDAGPIIPEFNNVEATAEL